MPTSHMMWALFALGGNVSSYTRVYTDYYITAGSSGGEVRFDIFQGDEDWVSPEEALTTLKGILQSLPKAIAAIEALQ